MVRGRILWTLRLINLVLLLDAMVFYARVANRAAGVSLLGYKTVVEARQSVALLQHMYHLVSDKRQARNALLSGLVKVLEVDLTSSEVEVTFLTPLLYNGSTSAFCVQT